MSNEKKKLKTCTTCEKEIAKNAKVCPHCGGKVKKPFYKRGWFIVLAVVVIIGVIAGTGNENKTSTSTQTESKQAEQIEYISYDVSEMVTDLQENAMNAENKYDGQFVEITGRLGNIDSDGSYISLYPTDNEFSLTSVQCYIKSDEQKTRVAELKKGDIVTLKGKITSVGEVMGYSLNINQIN